MERVHKLWKFRILRKDITDDVTLNFVVQDWERTFDRLNKQPNVVDVLDKIQHGGNLWSWYQSQYTHQDSHGSIPSHDIIDNWTWEHFKRELRSSHLNKVPDRAAIRKDFDELQFPPFPSIAELESFKFRFQIGMFRRYHLGTRSSQIMSAPAQKITKSVFNCFW